MLTDEAAVIDPVSHVMILYFKGKTLHIWEENSMKLITAIVNKDDSYLVQTGLVNAGFQVTRLATTGGFLQAGNVTFLTACEDDKVDDAIEIIRSQSSKRQQIVPSTATYGSGLTTSYPIEVTVGGATVIVQPIERFIKL